MSCVSLTECVVESCEIPGLMCFANGVPGSTRLSPYWRMSESDREARKEYSRMRYKDPVIRDRMKKHHYLKCLRSGLILRPSARTLARHGMVVRDGEFVVVS